MRKNIVLFDDAKIYTNKLYLLLKDRQSKVGYGDICDVLFQVSKKLDNTKNVEVLINRLVNYMRITASTNRINFSKDEEAVIIEIGVIGQKAGLNGQYMADFSDKSQFYSIFER